MPINVDLLVSAPMLQDYLVDKDNGLPLSNGTITMFQDNSRTTLKNWYYQTGVPGNYTYITLPNPMTLSAVGTMEDFNGNDIIPFYYPYDENNSISPQPYYVVVQNENGETQFTRQNFPFIPGTVTPTTGNSTNQNLIVNNVFWRNIGSLNATTLSNSISLNGSNVFYTTIAPSQHDGFIMQDIQFFKNANGAVDNINFYQFVPPASNPTFPDQVLGNGDPTPEFYLNIECTGTGMETTKYVQVPLSLHVKSLSGYAYGHFTIDAMAVPGSTNAQITVGVYQFLGTGVLSPVVVPTETIVLGNSWNKYDISMPLPSAANLTLGSGGDDALYIVIGYPVGETFNINIAKPSFYLSEDVPTDDFETYDMASSIFDSPRTGDIRTSINSFTPFGWVPMNDGTIGDPSSNATTRANSDTWPLFNQLWTIAQPYDSGSNSNPICQMYTSGGAATNFGSTAIGDFTANKGLALTRMFGRVVLGTAPIASLLTTQKTTFTASNSGGNLVITTSNTVAFFTGMPISFTNTGGALPTGLVANAIYYVCAFNGTNTFNVSTSFANAMSITVIAYTNAGSGTNTVTGGNIGSSEGEYGHSQLLQEVGNHTHIGPSGTSFVVSGTGLASPGAGASFASNSQTGTVFYNGASQSAFNVTQPGSFMNIFMKL